MKKSPIPSEVATVRSDVSGYLWHFAREDSDPFGAITNILDTKLIKGSKDRDTRCFVTCFTEAPLEQIRRQAPILRKHKYPRFSLYGIGFPKMEIFRADGLPVIYGRREQLKKLPEEFRWRHVDLDLDTKKGIDYSWMREWRIEGDFIFNHLTKDAIVVAPEVGEFEGKIYDIIEDGDFEDGEPVNSPHLEVHWSFISLDWHTLPITDVDIILAIKTTKANQSNEGQLIKPPRD